MNINKFLKESEWVMKNYRKLQKRYPDQWIVVKNHKVIKHGIDIDYGGNDYSIFITSGADIL